MRKIFIVTSQVFSVIVLQILSRVLKTFSSIAVRRNENYRMRDGPGL